MTRGFRLLLAVGVKFLANNSIRSCLFLTLIFALSELIGIVQISCAFAFQAVPFAVTFPMSKFPWNIPAGKIHIRENIFSLENTSHIKTWEATENDFTPSWEQTNFSDADIFGKATECKHSYHIKPGVQPYLGKSTNAVLYCDGTWIEGNIYYSPVESDYLVDRSHKLDVAHRVPTNFFIEHGFAMLTKYSHSYFHMLIEVLPILYRLFRNGTDKTIIMHKCNKFMIDEMFSMFNMSLKYYCMTRDASILVKELYFIPPKKMLQLDITGLQMLRDLYLRKMFHRNGNTTRYVYLKHFRNRRIRNYKSMMKAIHQKFPFMKFEVPILISLEYQIKLFQDCLICMGPHGSAFANGMWMPKNAVLFEISNSYCHSAVFDMARQIGLKLYITRFPRAREWRPVLAPIKEVLHILQIAVDHLTQCGLLCL